MDGNKKVGTIFHKGTCCLWFFPFFSAHPCNHLPLWSCWLGTEWKLFPYDSKCPLEDTKIHISCIKEKKNQNPGLPGSGKYSDHLVPEFYLLLLCQLPLMPWQPSHSSVTTAASSGLAALISLSALPPFPFGNRCSSFVYIPPFSWIALTFTNWGFHKLLGRKGKLVKVGLMMANGNSVLELQNLEKPSVAQQVN